ncbi:GTP-binding protein [Rhizopogon salebrosus TDB-379]|nr:GTP-binding protein [Rhizopogon salebrosus TDB-379]
MEPTQGIREKFGRFRILVVGRANAGKTTLLQRICNTTEKPEIFDRMGNKIGAAVVQGTVNRGYHNIENELVFRSNRDYVFHDSCGFESGGEDEFKKMKEFVLDRASTTKLKERIHAIWYCIPMDECHRAITKAEERFFSECDTNNVPVIAVFTKFDALWDDAYGQLKRSGLTRRECSNRAPERAREIFANAKIWDRLRETQYKYPPKDFVCVAEMEKYTADCVPLLEITTSALGEEAMQMLLISTQRTNMALCVKYAVEK